MAVHTIIPFQYGNELFVTCARINLLTWYEKLSTQNQVTHPGYRSGGDVPCAPVQDERQHSLRIYDFDAGSSEPGDLECDVDEERDEAE